MFSGLRRIGANSLSLTLGIVLSVGLAGTAAPQDRLPTAIPGGTKLVVADQNEALQTLMMASGEQGSCRALQPMPISSAAPRSSRPSGPAPWISRRSATRRRSRPMPPAKIS